MARSTTTWAFAEFGWRAGAATPRREVEERLLELRAVVDLLLALAEGVTV